MQPRVIRQDEAGVSRPSCDGRLYLGGPATEPAQNAQRFSGKEDEGGWLGNGGWIRDRSEGREVARAEKRTDRGRDGEAGELGREPRGAAHSRDVRHSAEIVEVSGLQVRCGEDILEIVLSEVRIVEPEFERVANEREKVAPPVQDDACPYKVVVEGTHPIAAGVRVGGEVAGIGEEADAERGDGSVLYAVERVDPGGIVEQVFNRRGMCTYREERGGGEECRNLTFTGCS